MCLQHFTYRKSTFHCLLDKTSSSYLHCSDRRSRITGNVHRALYLTSTLHQSEEEQNHFVVHRALYLTSTLQQLEQELIQLKLSICMLQKHHIFSHYMYHNASGKLPMTNLTVAFIFKTQIFSGRFLNRKLCIFLCFFTAEAKKNKHIPEVFQKTT